MNKAKPPFQQPAHTPSAASIAVCTAAKRCGSIEEVIKAFEKTSTANWKFMNLYNLAYISQCLLLNSFI